jgi:hypothetical protein
MKPQLPSVIEFMEAYLKAHPELTEQQVKNIRAIVAKMPEAHAICVVRNPIDPKNRQTEAG